MLRTTCVALALALTCPAVSAQTKPDFETAKRHYLAGKDAVSKKDYDTAVREYILAYDITKDPSLFKQIGAAYEAQGKPAEATVYYRRYLAEAKSAADAEDVRARLAGLEGGGKRAEAPKPEAPKAAPKPAEAKPTETLPPEPPKLPPPEAPPPGPEIKLSQPPLPTYADTESRWQRTAAWVSVGLAAVGITTGSVLATSALGREEDIRRLIDYRDPVSGMPLSYSGTTKDDYQSKIDEGQRLQTFATVAFVGAGVFAAAATVFFILDATRPVAKERAAIMPYLGPGGGGVGAAWTF